MSDVGDVNRAHQNNPETSVLDAYMLSARRVFSGEASPSDALTFRVLHSPKNVVLLANMIDRLRAENAAVLDKFMLDTEN